MRKSNVDKFREQVAVGSASKRREINGITDLLWMMLGGQPLPTQTRFITDSVDEQRGRLVRVKGYMGPLGCAKTATLCAAGLLRSLILPGSRLLVARLTYGELETTTQSRFLELVHRLPPGLILDYNKTPPGKLVLLPIVAGATEPSEVFFHSLDDPQKLASVEFTDAIIDEATEITSDIAHKIETRLGRRHAGLRSGPFFMMMAFNPPSTSHWIYTESEGSSNPYIKLYRPRPNENSRNLPDGYYDSLSRNMTPELRRRLIEGEWGADFGGKAVYPEFDQSIHLDRELKFVPGEPTFRFWDFGYNNPCCLIAQRSAAGHIKVLHEIDGSRLEIESFIELVRSKMKQAMILEPDYENGGADYGDPSAYQHRDTGQTAARMYGKGVNIVGFPSKIDDGIGVVRNLLLTSNDGVPMLRVHPRCVRLMEALMGGYRYKEVKHNQIPKVAPYKDDYYDHSVDALRYGCINLNLGLMSGQGINSSKQMESMRRQTSVLELAED